MINYSYINTVFPNYENSASYNVKMFNELNSVNPMSPKGIKNESLSSLKRSPEEFQLNNNILVEKETTQPIKQMSIQDNIINQGINDINDIINNYALEPKQTQPTIKPVQKQILKVPEQDTFDSDKINDTRYYSSYNSVPTSYYTPENLNFYNEPILKYDIPKKEIKSDSSYIESFNEDCHGHVLTCNKCKELYKRNFNNVKENDEMWDILSYILFAIFIVFLLDKLH